jgi:hypothetical protein
MRMETGEHNGSRKHEEPIETRLAREAAEAITQDEETDLIRKADTLKRTRANMLGSAALIQVTAAEFFMLGYKAGFEVAEDYYLNEDYLNEADDSDREPVRDESRD